MEHNPDCRAVNFDAAGKYTGTMALDVEQCETCRDETSTN